MNNVYMLLKLDEDGSMGIKTAKIRRMVAAYLHIIYHIGIHVTDYKMLLTHAHYIAYPSNTNLGNKSC